MAITEVYVDPSIAADSGTGTSGDPYGDLEYAIEQTTFDTTNGTRVNIKAGTDEVLAANLATALADTGTTAAWAPAYNAPCVFQGYTTTAGDGGKGGISGGGSVSIFDSASQNYVYFVDCRLHNTGSNIIVHLGQCGFLNCEMDNSSSTSTDVVSTAGKSFIIGCHIHNIAGSVKADQFSNLIAFNYFANGTNDFSAGNGALYRPQGFVYRNVFDLDGTSSGMSLNGGAFIMNNSFYSNGGTGSAIIGGTFAETQGVFNNLIEGFSGTGGHAVNCDAANSAIRLYGGNTEYNNATGFEAPPVHTLSNFGAANETAAASPFNAPATQDFAPVDTDSVKEGSVPADFGDGAI